MWFSDPDGLGALLPFGMGLARPLLFAVSAFATSCAVTWLAARASLPAARRFAHAHWTERARLTFAARTLTTLFPMLCVGMFPALAVWLEAPQALPLGVVGVAVVATAALLGGCLGAAPVLEQASGRPRSWLRLAKGSLLMPVVMLPQLIIVGAMAWWIGPTLDLRAAVVGVVGLAAFAASVPTAGVPVARWLGAVRPAPERLASAVARAAAETGIEPRSAEEIELPFANAFAFPWSRRLVFTREAVACLNDEELYAITCHELGHLAEPLSAKVGRAVPPALLLPFGFARPLWELGGWVVLAAVYVVAFVSALTVAHWLRKLEVRADAVAHDHEVDAGSYARALERIYERNLTPAVTGNRRAVHPDLYDRMEGAGCAPDYPRPAPPPPLRPVLGAVVGLLALIPLAVLTAALPATVPDLLAEQAGRAETSSVVRVALTGGSTGSLRGLSSAWYSAGRFDEAAFLLEIATRQSPRDHTSWALFAQLAGARGRCAEGVSRLEAARASANASHADECPWIATAQTVLETHCPPDAPANPSIVSAR